MNRERLSAEVQGLYASLARQDTQRHISESVDRTTPEQYYETVLGMVLSEISRGTFDTFDSGRAVVDAVSKDKKKWLSQWDTAMEP